MSSWRDRLCGSVAMGNPGDQDREKLEQFFNPNHNISCGGGFYPASYNSANMSTHKKNFVLPTKNYSVLIFKEDGSAVIYSDDEPISASEEAERAELKLTEM